MKRGIYIFIFSVLLYSCEKAPGDFESNNFIKYFGSGYESRGYDVIQLSDGNYVFTGYDKVNTTDFQVLAVKVDKFGNEIWSKTYGSTDEHEEGRIVKQIDGGFLIAGTSISLPVTPTSITHSFILQISNEGDSLWYKEFGDPSINITVKDFVVDNGSIFVAGTSIQPPNSNSDYYSERLSMTGTNIWESISFENSNSFFQRVFLKEGNSFFIGYHGDANNIEGLSLNLDGGIEEFPPILENTEETLANAELIDNDLYILTNAESTKLYKFTADDFTKVWETESVSSVAGKTFTEFGSSLLVLGESTIDGNTHMNVIKVDAAGTAVHGPNAYRTIQGSVNKVIPTIDEGIILIGSTNATFGVNVQLIKTGKDLFLFKPLK